MTINCKMLVQLQKYIVCTVLNTESAVLNDKEIILRKYLTETYKGVFS